METKTKVTWGLGAIALILFSALMFTMGRSSNSPKITTHAPDTTKTTKAILVGKLNGCEMFELETVKGTKLLWTVCDSARTTTIVLLPK